jgi:hypothetical protein
MIAAIARKELLEAWRDGRFCLAGVVILALLGVALLLAWQQARLARTERAAAAALERENWLNQGEKNSHAAGHYGVYAFKPPAPLATLSVPRRTGPRVASSHHRQPWRNLRTRGDPRDMGAGESAPRAPRSRHGLRRGPPNPMFVKHLQPRVRARQNCVHSPGGFGNEVAINRIHEHEALETRRD